MTVHGLTAPDSEQTLRLSKAILIYESNGTGQLATVHDIRTPDAGRPESAPGSPSSRTAIAEIAEMLTKEGDGPVRRELIPEHLLFADGATLIWWKPMHRAPIFFRTGRKEFDEAMNEATPCHPPLLFKATSGHISVWALGKNERPSLESPLFQAPYFNIYDTGSMCTGNVRLPETMRQGAIPAFEAGFFSTNFTHTNAGATLTSFAGGHDGLWKMLAETGADFPLDALVASKSGISPKTLGDALRSKR
jgi:PRTRC genetic system protein B